MSLTWGTDYFAYNDIIRSVKNDTYKLIQYRNYANKTQLFNIKEDPDELLDLYGKPEYSHIVDQLRRDLNTFKEEWDDTSHPLGAAYWKEKNN